MNYYNNKTNIHKKRIFDPLKPLPGEFWESGDYSALMKQATPWIIDFCSRRLNHDPDVVGDFYLYIYERIRTCLARYQTRQDLPFTGYLATYLRHEYYNFIKPRRRFRLSEFNMDDYNYGNLLLISTLKLNSEEESYTSSDLNLRLNLMTVSNRLPIKLHYGFRLSCEELRYIARHASTPGFAASFLTEYNRRIAIKLQKAQDLHNRAAHLTYLLQVFPQRKDLQSTPADWRRWKKRIEITLQAQRVICNQKEISSLLNLNRSTVSRRIRNAMKELERCRTPLSKSS